MSDALRKPKPNHPWKTPWYGKTNKPREEPRYISAEIKVGAIVRVRSASGMTGKSAYMGLLVEMGDEFYKVKDRTGTIWDVYPNQVSLCRADNWNETNFL